MTPQEIVEKVQASLPEDILKAELSLGDAVIHVSPEKLKKAAGFLKNDPDLAFDYLSDIRGVDYLNMEREPRFEAVYELHSLGKNHSLRIKVGLPEENPTLPTVSDLWRGAEFPERELYDMFGFNIEGLANLKRFIMPEGWEGHPLRKDYPLIVEPVAFSFNRDFKSDLVKSKPTIR
ncbi:MAG: NADH-quinone oxidoreductase subunit C [Nitrospinae bacterium]|nr:NADH-quinone oxidoreductase subunit C [Nitrospinota bacterium]